MSATSAFPPSQLTLRSKRGRHGLRSRSHVGLKPEGPTPARGGSRARLGSKETRAKATHPWTGTAVGDPPSRLAPGPLGPKPVRSDRRPGRAPEGPPPPAMPSRNATHRRDTIRVAHSVSVATDEARLFSLRGRRKTTAERDRMCRQPHVSTPPMRPRDRRPQPHHPQAARRDRHASQRYRRPATSAPRPRDVRPCHHLRTAGALHPETRELTPVDPRLDAPARLERRRNGCRHQRRRW
jgi:hypothetical protein